MGASDAAPNGIAYRWEEVALRYIAGKKVIITSFFLLGVKEFWDRAVAAYGHHVADRLDEETPLLLAFLPAGIGGLMLWSGDAGSMVFGGLCCFLGLAVFLLYLGNEQRVYVEEKKEQQHRDELGKLRLDDAGKD